MALTELAVKKAKASDKPQKLADGGGMYLLIQTSGSKCWRMDCRRGRTPRIVHPLDQHYMNLRNELDKTFETLGLAA